MGLVVIDDHVLVFIALVVVAVGEAVVDDAAGMLARLELYPPIFL